MPAGVLWFLPLVLILGDVSAILLRKPDGEIAPHCNKSDECNTYFVNSYGFLTAMDVRPSKPNNDAPTVDPADYIGKIKNQSTVYVISSALPDFIGKVWHTIPRDISFVLVTGAAVTSVPFDDKKPPKGGKLLGWTQEEFAHFINDPRISHWFTQNAVARHHKLTAIPLGIDYRWLNRMGSGKGHIPGHAWGDHMTPQEQESQFLGVIKAQKPWRERESAAYADFHFQMDSRGGSGSRQHALHSLRQTKYKDSIHWATKRRDRVDVWKEYGKHKYVVAPVGVGLDSYRVWEALILGSIPIVPRSELADSELYEGLHVKRVIQWSMVDVPGFIESATSSMDNSSQEGEPVFNEKLTLEYWLRLIREAAVRGPPSRPQL